ncbi:MAG: GNAT family protein [Oscillospiraceae bacterium]
MEHQGTVSLETSRLILRRFRLDDSVAAFRNWTHDDRVTEFLSWNTHENIVVTEKVIKMWVDSYADKNFYQWAIAQKENDESIGAISIVEQNEELNSVQIGYCIGSKWWHKGYTSEAFTSIIPFLFEKVKVNRIESKHDPLNPNSGKVMLKCGLKYEGTLRQAAINNKGIVDAAMYSILAEEYGVLL